MTKYYFELISGKNETFNSSGVGSLSLDRGIV